MSKNTLKLIILLVLFVLVSIPIFTSSISDRKQREENEANYQILLKEERARKKAEARAEKILYLTGKFNPEQRSDFVSIPLQNTLLGNEIYLRRETLRSFLRMQEFASISNINLKIASATRNFDYQKNIWDRKWSGYTLVDGKDLSESIPDGEERFKKILEYSAAPGTSRHHWGTDIDINNANTSYFNTKEGIEVYDWLTENASRFGFCQTYTPKSAERVTGYNEEKWHWTYTPLSKAFTQEYKSLIKREEIEGFMGEEYASSLNLIDNYVLGINPDCF